jgi:hypothetical protein
MLPYVDLISESIAAFDWVTVLGLDWSKTGSGKLSASLSGSETL